MFGGHDAASYTGSVASEGSRFLVIDAATHREASRVAPLVAPDRLLLARELRRMTQKELVEATGRAFTTAALSQLEQGYSRPSPATLAAIAEAVNFPLGFFVARPNDQVPRGFFRSLRSANACDRRQYLARARLLHDFISAVEEHVRLPELDVPRLEVDLEEDEAVEAAAETVRVEWGLGSGPVGHVIRQLERHGVVVVRTQTFQREVDASVNFPGRPVVVLGVDKAVTARSRLTRHTSWDTWSFTPRATPARRRPRSKRIVSGQPS